MTCCYTDEERDECPNRRMAGLPMCQKHMMRTFRDALVEGALPPDVFAEITREAAQVLKVGQVVQRFENHRVNAAVHLEHEQRERKRQAAKENPVVYYVQLTGGRVKIGWTTNLPQRLAQFRCRPDDVLATEPGGYEVETRRHRQFAHLRIGRSEEFREDRVLTAHIRAIRTGQPA